MKRVLMIAVLAGGLLGGSGAAAMTMQLGDQPDGRPTFLYRFQRPYFAGDVDPELFTGYHEFQAQVPLSGRLCAVMALPVARVFDDELSDEDALYPERVGKTILGNVYLGIHDQMSPGGLAVDAGAFLPTAGHAYGMAAFMAMLSDPHHYQRFFPDLLTLRVTLARAFVARSGLYVRGELGPDVWLPMGDNTRNDVEMIVRYGIGVGVSGARWDGGVEFVGWAIATESEATFSEASAHVLSAGVERKGDRVTPGVFASIPTDEAFTAVDWLLGVRLKVALD
ncbi:MAG: hypothetical protein ACYDIE_04195 [Candidatus Krumholzibacteriia bacterium]